MDNDSITDDYTELRAIINELIELYLWRLKPHADTRIADVMRDQRPIERLIGVLVEAAGAQINNESLEERPMEWLE